LFIFVIQLFVCKSEMASLELVVLLISLYVELLL